jgi:WD40 repeat protein
LIRTLRGHTNKVASVSFSPDCARLASAGADCTVMIWDLTADRDIPLRTLRGHKNVVWCVSYSPDGTRLASASGDGTVKIWDPTGSQEALTIDGQDSTSQRVSVYGVAFHSHGELLATANESGAVKIRDVTTGQKLFEAHVEPTTPGVFAGRNLVFSPKGEWLATPDGDGVQLWRFETNRAIRTLALRGHNGSVQGVAFSPDGKRLASAGDDLSVRVWDAGTGTEFLPPMPQETEVHGLNFSSDGKWLAWGSESGSVHICDATTGQSVRQLTGHTSGIRGLTFSPDGKQLVSVSADQTARIWDVATGEEVLILRGHANSVWGVAFSPDGTRLATSDLYGVVKVWDARSMTPDAGAEREALGLLEFLFAKPLCHADVIELLHSSATIRPRARELALSLVRSYQEEPAPEPYHRASWAVVHRPYLSAFQYRVALLQAQHASRLAPDRGSYRIALAAAFIRTGRYREALDTLVHLAKLYALPWPRPRPERSLQ